MTLTYLIVVEIMCRRDFYATGAEFRVDVVVRNNGDSALAKGQRFSLEPQFSITGFGSFQKYIALFSSLFEKKKSNLQ